MTLAGGALMWTLPETLNHPLPDTIADVEDWTTSSTKQKPVEPDIEFITHL
jgi:hypothetical protein